MALCLAYSLIGTLDPCTGSDLGSLQWWMNTLNCMVGIIKVPHKLFQALLVTVPDHEYISKLKVILGEYYSQ